MQATQLQTALKRLGDAIRETDAVLQAMRADPDPLAVHIFVSRRQYRNLADTKGGKRHALTSRLTWQAACNLGYRGDLGEWERLLGAASRR